MDTRFVIFQIYHADEIMIVFVGNHLDTLVMQVGNFLGNLALTFVALCCLTKLLIWVAERRIAQCVVHSLVARHLLATYSNALCA